MNGEDGQRPDPGELELARRIRALPRSIEPQRDLWPQIAERLAGGTSRGHAAGWPSLAAAVALVTISATATLWWSERDRLPARSLQHAEFVLARYEGNGTAYLQARASLAIDVEARLERLPPATQAKIRENLGEIRRALAEISAALARDPDNVLLQQLLVTTYQQELAVLTDLTRVIEAASKPRIPT